MAAALAVFPQRQSRRPSASSRQRRSSLLTTRCQGDNGNNGSSSNGSNGSSGGGGFDLNSIDLFAGNGASGSQKTRPNSEKPTGVGSDTGSPWKAP